MLPATPLGSVARDWLFAHNQGDGHAAVHFTLENRGSAAMSGAQVDSAVYAGVKFARDLGPLVLVTLLQSSDTSLAVLLHSKTGDKWKARFTPAAQPSMVKVRVELGRTR